MQICVVITLVNATGVGDSTEDDTPVEDGIPEDKGLADQAAEILI